MKLLRLLSAGRSLVGLKDGGNRYRPSSKGALPVFRPVRNSFRTTVTPTGRRQESAAETECQPETAGAPGQAQGRFLEFADKEQSHFPDAVSPPANTQQRSVESNGARVGCARQSPAGGGNGDSLKAGRFPWWPFGKRKTSGIPPLPKKPVPLQGELSLDNVKVVRNDLRDSDIDLVPAGSAKRVRKAAQNEALSGDLGKKGTDTQADSECDGNQAVRKQPQTT